MENERKKLNILVVIDELPEPVWEQVRASARLSFAREGGEAYRLLAREKFDVLFLDLYLTGMDSLELLRRCRREKLCGTIILTSAAPSFSYAQQGILYGVSAYLLRPLQAKEIEEAVRKARYVSGGADLQLEEAVSETVGCLRDPDAAEVFLRAGRGLISATGSAIEHSIRWRDFYEKLIDRSFQRHSWLRLYHNPTEYAALDYIQDSDIEMVINFCLRKVWSLNETLTQLYPKSNQKLEDILRLLLGAIDENLQQKEVAERCFITGSTLSTRFQRGLGISYREYVTRLKIARGQYLLRYTDVRPEDLAKRLGYKDRDYFSKLFHQRTGQTLQECTQRSWGEYSI